MEIRYTFEDLGSWGGYAPKLKRGDGYGNSGNMWATIGSMAVSLGSSIWGAKKSADANNEAKRKEEAAHAANLAYYKRKYNENYADTAAGKNILRQANNYADKNWKKSQGAAAVGGGTDASVAMAKESGDKTYGNALANIASSDQANKRAAGDQIAQEVSGFGNASAAALRTQGNNIATATSGLGNAIASGVSALGSSSSRTNNINDAQSNLTGNAVSTLKNTDPNVGMKASEKAAFGSSTPETQEERVKSAYRSMI